MMRVLYFTAGDSPHDRRFLTALGHVKAQVYSLRMQVCEPVTPAGITELAWPAGQPDWSYWAGWQEGIIQLRTILADLKPDLVHAGPLQGPAFLTALSGFKPLVSMSWGFDLLRSAKRSPWMRKATRYTLEHSSVFVADCQTVADQAANYGFEPGRMMLFPWGVDLVHFSPDQAREAGLALKSALGWGEQFVVCCNRAWSGLYGVDTLAQAFVRAHQEQPDLRLLLAGDGPQSERVRAILAQAGDAVHYPGWLAYQDLPAFYGVGDLYVSPSHYDGSSVSLMEALACGKPVLVSDIPSNREWVNPGMVGDLFKDGDVDSLTEQLLALASDPQLARYGQQARLLAEARADWTQNFQRLHDAYKMAIK